MELIKKHILVVDDDPPLRTLFQALLESYGFTSDTADNGGEAITKLTRESYDAVLLDHDVQAGRGPEWLRDLSGRPHFPPIIYFIDSIEEAELEAAHASGAHHVLARGEFEHDQLVMLLRMATVRRHNVLAETSRAAREPPATDRFGSARIRGYRCLRRLGSR